MTKSREYEPLQRSVQSQHPPYLQLQSKLAKSYDVNDAVERRRHSPGLNPNLVIDLEMYRLSYYLFDILD